MAGYSGTPLANKPGSRRAACCCWRACLQTLTQFGGYARAQPGTPARKGERRYYVLSCDWQQDTLHSVRELDPGAPQNEDSFLPVAYAFFLCEDHALLTGNINFQDNLLNVLLSRQPSPESK